MRRNLLLTGAIALTLCLTRSAAAEEAAAPAPAAPAAEANAGQIFSTIAVPAGLTPKQVGESISKALLGREWLVKERADGKVVGYLKHRRNEAQVTFTYDDKQVTMSCWGYKLDRSGDRQEATLPTGWLRNLEKDLQQALNVAQFAPKT